MSATQFVFETMNSITCASCAVMFGITESYQKRKMKDHTTFHCPNGHENVYRGDSEEQRLKRELEKANQRVAWAERSRDYAQKDAKKSEMKARAFKGIATKIKKRVGNGVCPCCNRTFQNLMSHMKTQHPKFKETK